ncbi:MAG TPA: hypothetical protein DDY68_06195 [Porphyromonadaceae bacterium]|nr:hypothetical protein [Porphyromonadaceae bacterium]
MSNYYDYENEEKSYGLSTTFSTLMRNVYAWMSGGLLITALIAFMVSNNESIIRAIFGNSILMWGLLIGEVIVVMILSGRIHKMSFSTAGFLFVLYSALNGITLSVIFLAYTMESIASVFFITAGTFAVMSFLGYTTKKNLSTMGRILYMLLIGVVIATIVNIFLHSSGLALILNYVGVVIFVGLTAYDTQKIKNMLLQCNEEEVSEQSSKLALLGSLTLYLDFINLFLYLLRFLGNRRD